MNIQIHRWSCSGHWRGVEHHQSVVQPPVFGPGFLAATSDIQHQTKEFPAHLLDGSRSVGDRACIDIHQVMPAPRQVTPRGHLDYRYLGEPVGRAAPGCEHMQVHARGQFAGCRI